MRRVWASVGITAVIALLVSCGGDDEEAGSPGPQASQAGAAGGTVQVTAVDYAFQNLPATATVGTKFALTNSSSSEVHELTAIRLPDDETRPVSRLLELPPDERQRIAGRDPAMMLLALPASPGIALVGDGSFAEPGRYAIVIPTGADPDAFLRAGEVPTDGLPQVEGGPPHVAQGMFGEVVIQ